MTPILYSFRRCPYAMRARLAIQSAQICVELREVVLRDKPQAFLDVSPSATVPCLVHASGVIDESLDIMQWALAQNDPLGWLNMPKHGFEWIVRNDGPFKHALDRTKYASRYPDEDASAHCLDACAFLADLDAQLGLWMFDHPTLADFAIAPFVRQFAFIDKAWFDTQPWPDLHRWLDQCLTAPEFAMSMQKFPQWHVGDAPFLFPQDGD
ncbi:glutathione S-transferase [uncultured Sulfitobacter sp.]|uniref:glutathione S-transferase n=1 Tax=uncultured Sulfitobacter sp. TaxID=191468 RepID=UPI00260BF5F1|nr:glutathione S-transferase [uncultured Sulfitobacter sp.]